MRNLVTRLAMLSAIAASATMLAHRAEAAGPPGVATLNDAAERLALLEPVQVYFYQGRRYCWYPDGWRGPGWYWCGYHWRPGFGWGGPLGWGPPGFRPPGWGPGWMGGPFPGGPMGGPPGGPMGGPPGGPMGGFPGGGPMGGPPGGGGPMGGPPGGGGPMGGPPGGGGPMGGFPSDIRVKHDVVLLGRLDNGVGFYRFSYNGSDKAYVGVMAHEVETVRPDAVVRGSDGYLRVYYDRLGVRMQRYEDWVAAGEKIPAGFATRQ